MKYSIIFVCQHGFLEAQSLLLAASLREFLTTDCELIAAIPENMGEINTNTKAALQRLDVRLHYFQNDFNPIAPMGNKPLSTQCEVNTDRKIFIDSDCICMKPFSPDLFCLSDIFCFCESPSLAYSEKEWEFVSKLFDISVSPVSGPNGINLMNMNTPIISFWTGIGLEERWLQFAKKLHAALTEGNIKIKRYRKIANLSFNFAVRSLDVDVHTSEPLTWDGSANWWDKPKCICHEWETDVPVSKRIFNKYLCAPDHVYYYQNEEQKCLGIPYFFVLQNGMGYCSRHQGEHKQLHDMGLAHYEPVRKHIYMLLDKYPFIDKCLSWEDYMKAYFFNKNTKWFVKPEHYWKKQIML